MSIEPPINLDDLKKPFHASDIEWRVQSAGKKKDGDIWAQVLAYITNRAIMDRLDDVVGPSNWRNEYTVGPGGGVLCGLSIKIDSEWVTKWDGAENTEFEPVKGGLSNAMKRAAVHWGVGRYLYDLEVGWAHVNDKGQFRGALPKDKGGDSFRWDPPMLPEWARSASDNNPRDIDQTPQTKSNGKAKTNAKPPYTPPGDDVSPYSAASSAIDMTASHATLDRYEAAVNEGVKSGKFTKQEGASLSTKIKTQREKIDSQEPATA